MSEQKEEKSDLHLKVNAPLLREFKAQCALADLDLSKATEALYRLWISGEVTVINDIRATKTTNKGGKR